MKRFSGKVILITGASSGIGAAVAQAFAAEGASLMLSARRLERLNELAATCRNLGARCEVMQTDIQDEEQTLKLVEKTLQYFTQIDVLVNNAGIGTYGLFHQQPWTEIRRTLQTNLTGALFLCHTVVPHMVKQKSGMIVNVSSVIGKRAIAHLASYCASKFGLWGFSHSLRLELKEFGIQVCHFCPRATSTEFQNLAGFKSDSHADSSETVAKAMVQAVLKRKSEHIMSLRERFLIKCWLLAPNLTDRLLRLRT